MQKKLCICCLYRFEIDQLNFYKVKPGFQYSGFYQALCEKCNEAGREIYAGYLEINSHVRSLKNAA